MELLHRLTRIYPGLSPYQLSREPAGFWLPYLTILEEADLAGA